MIHVILISGGKDSMATALKCREDIVLKEGDTTVYLHCETGFEAKETDDYIDRMNEKMFEGKLIKIRSKQYKNFASLVIQKGRVPSTKARFCTDELKIKPMMEWIVKQEDDMVIYQGIRAQESSTRALMQKEEEYFRVHLKWELEGKGSEYRKSARKPYIYDEVMAHLENYSVDVSRPIFDWDWQKVFEIHKKYDVEINPLYKKGFTRVGCMPCIMANHGEIKSMVKFLPEYVDRIEAIETLLGRSFFTWDKVPDKFCKEPNIKDVIDYITRNDDPNQGVLFDDGSSSCMSIYGLCE